MSLGAADMSVCATFLRYAESMADDTTQISLAARTRDEIALEMMKFIAVTTGYGKGTGAAGFTGKTAKTPEEYTDALLQLFERCRAVIGKD
jgi:hypothetical protein